MNNEWQPIETAPKDGSWVLGYYAGGNWRHSQVDGGKQTCSGRHNMVVMHYDKSQEGQGNELVWSSFGPSSYMKCVITHWMPLPELPDETEK